MMLVMIYSVWRKAKATLQRGTKILNMKSRGYQAQEEELCLARGGAGHSDKGNTKLSLGEVSNMEC